MTRAPIKRGPRKKRPKTATRKKQVRKMTLRRQCDSLCSKIARLTYGACATCGRTDFLQWSHHISRRYLALRYDPLNFTVHCRSCHLFFTRNPLRHEEWIVGYIGEEAYRELKRRALETERYRPDYPAILADLSKQLKEAS